MIKIFEVFFFDAQEMWNFFEERCFCFPLNQFDALAGITEEGAMSIEFYISQP